MPEITVSLPNDSFGKLIALAADTDADPERLARSYIESGLAQEAEELPSARELDLLIAIARYVGANRRRLAALRTDLENPSLPDIQWLANKLHVSVNAICNYKRSLKNKGYLQSSQLAMLADDAWQFLASLQTVIPTRVPVLGEVQAGQAMPGDLVDNVTDMSIDLQSVGSLIDIGVPDLTIPHITETSLIFALQVVGDSMEYERIFRGDYILVEKLADTEMPKQGELIVTRYLAKENERYVSTEEIKQRRVPDDLLNAPTVKYFYGKENSYRLSWQKDVHKSLYTVETRYVWPIIGRVVGVYREVEKDPHS